MQVGIIGVGTVGGTLRTWFEEYTNHSIRSFDPGKGLEDDLTGSDAIFVCVPVPPNETGQDISLLATAVTMAKMYSDFVFVRSTVLPGTCDLLNCISMPEFLTERRAYEDMKALPIVVGKTNQNLLDRLFPNKALKVVSNREAELGKILHNCYGALKVTFFNMCFALAEKNSSNFDAVKDVMFITRFIEKTHTEVPGPDGQLGYGGKCFPDNVLAFKVFLSENGFIEESDLFQLVHQLNDIYRYPGERS